MSVLSNFENKVEGAIDGAAAAVFPGSIEPAQIAKKAEKQMRREKLVGSGRQYAPTLYNVLVNERDDKRLFGFYPTLASELENFLYAKGTEAGMEFDTRPLVRFIPDPGLKKGRFDVIAEVVAAPIIKKLRAEEMEYYGLAPQGSAAAEEGAEAAPASRPATKAGNRKGRSPSTGASSSRFAGLDVPIDPRAIADAPAVAAVASHRGAPGAPHELPGLRGEAPASVPAAASRPKENDELAPVQDRVLDREDAPVIGHATLFNSSEQKQHRLDRRMLTVGRGKDNDIVVADANASRVHARFSQDATGKWKLTDLGSTNGTLLNDRPVTSAILKPGDQVTIGTTVLQFIE